MADWQIILCPILWNSNHWILYIADRKINKSFLIDPARTTLTDQIKLFQIHLTGITEHLTNPKKSINLEVSTNQYQSRTMKTIVDYLFAVMPSTIVQTQKYFMRRQIQKLDKT